MLCGFLFSSRRRHTRYWRDWSSDVCSSDLSRITRWPQLNEGIAVGALFGLATAIALLMPVHLNGGANAGSQTVLLVLAAPLGGVPAAIAAGVISLAAGLYQWTTGTSFQNTA